ncbi:MAG: alpha/beta fold hydrolase [Gemmatimonadetes bacterium]|nr:alpha/beta fold hydrolase [Gemmatimonadota bacterium]
MPDEHRPAITCTTFELPSADGGPPVRGDVRVRQGHRPDAAIVICHGFKGFRRFGFFPNLARAAAMRGFAAVTVDFSRNGIGPDGADTFSAMHRFAEHTHTRNLDEIRRVIDVVERGALLHRPVRRIGLFGHSRGGGEAVLAAAADPRVKALVTWAAIARVDRWTPEQVATWKAGGTVQIENARTRQMMPIGPGYWRDLDANRERLDILAAAARVAVPWLIVHGDADPSVPVDEGRELFEAAGERAELLVVEGADHGFNARHPYAGATPELRVAAEATLEWFGAHLD